MYEPLGVSKCDKCGKLIGQPKELIKILREAYMQNKEDIKASTYECKFALSLLVNLPKIFSLDRKSCIDKWVPCPK